MADRWSCASTTGVHPGGRLCSTYRGGAPVRLGSQGLAWSPCTSWISETAPDISLTQRCGRRASAGLKPNRKGYPCVSLARPDCAAAGVYPCGQVAHALCGNVTVLAILEAA